MEVTAPHCHGGVVWQEAVSLDTGPDASPRPSEDQDGPPRITGAPDPGELTLDRVLAARTAALHALTRSQIGIRIYDSAGMPAMLAIADVLAGWLLTGLQSKPK